MPTRRATRRTTTRAPKPLTLGAGMPKCPALPGPAAMSTRLMRQWSEMWTAVPQVVNQRLTRMALAGPSPSPADQREFHRMGAEKVQAFQESWAGMGAEALRLQQQWWLQLWQQSFTWPMALLSGRGGGAWASPWSRLPQQFTRDAHKVMGRGLAPVHQRATANARRLGKGG